MIFISHSSADAPAVNYFVSEVLQKSLGFSADEYFYSSAPGTGLRTGTDIDDTILEKIDKSDLIIYFLSQRFMETPYCLCEMGAAWAMGKRIFPIIIPDLKKADVPAIISRDFIKRMEDETLNDLKDIVGEVCQNYAKKIPSAHFSATTKSFLKEYPTIEKALPPPSSVSFADHEKMKELSDYYSSKLDEAQQEISRLKQEIEEIKKLKNQTEVEKYVLSKSPIEEIYSTLIGQVRKELNFSGDACKKVCFHIFNDNGSESRINALYREYEQQIDDAIDRKYFADNGVTLIFGDKAQNLKAALSDLALFLAEDSMPRRKARDKYNYSDEEHQALIQKIHDKIGFWPDIGDLDYWEKVLMW